MTQTAFSQRQSGTSGQGLPKIHLMPHLMWDVLQFDYDCGGSLDSSRQGIFNSSLTTTLSTEEHGETPAVEILVSTPPQVTVNTHHGGQAAPSGSSVGGTGPTPTTNPLGLTPNRIMVASEPPWTADTSWLWADQSMNTGLAQLDYLPDEPTITDLGGSSWWDFGHL